MGRTGVWLIGARGSVATTAIVGAAAVRAGAAAPTGCVAELPDFASAELPGLGELVFGGHDVVETPLRLSGRHVKRRQAALADLGDAHLANDQG